MSRTEQQSRSIRVFISSDMQELEAEREIAREVLHEAGHSPLAFELFPASSSSAPRAYIEAVENCDIFVAILWKTLRPAVVAELEEAAKLHKPILLFLKRLKDNERRGRQLESLLAKIGNRNSQLQDALDLDVVYKSEFRTLAEWRECLRDGIRNEIARLFSKPEPIMNPIAMYDCGTKIIRFAKRRLYLFQKMPSLLLGPRPYGQPKTRAIRHEKQFVEALERWIVANCPRQDCEFYYLFSAQETVKEIQDLKNKNPSWLPHFLQKIRKKIKSYKNIEKKHPGNIFIGMTEERASGPNIVGDDQYAIWLFGRAMAISHVGVKVCDMISQIYQTLYDPDMSADKIIEKLELQE